MKILFFAPLFFLSLQACAGVPREIRSPGDSFSVTLQEYSPAPSAQKINVIIYPPTGGSTQLDRSYAEKLAKLGARVVLIESWSEMAEEAVDPELHDRHIERAKKAFRLIKKEMGFENVRLMGTSVGGMYVAAIAASEPDVEAWVAIAAGGPFSQVIAHSDQGALLKRKEVRRGLWKFRDDVEYEAMLAAAISQDILAPRLKPLPLAGTEGEPSAGSQWKQTKILLVMGTEDTTVPYSSQVSLWNAAGRPRRIDINAGHFWTIVRAYWSYGNEISDFLIK